MCRLPESLSAWGSARFPDVIKAEIRSLGSGALSLHRLSTTGHALDTDVSVTLIGAEDAGDTLRVAIGVFFEEILTGCSCGDESEPRPGYGELSIAIDKVTARALLAPLER